MVLSGAFGKHQEGAEFGQLGRSLADRFENPRMWAESYFVNGNFLMPWVRPFREANAVLTRAFEMAGKFGATKDEIYSAVQQAGLFYAEGADLGETEERGAWAREIAQQRNSGHLARIANLIVQYAQSLRGGGAGIDDGAPDRSALSEVVDRIVRAELALFAGEVERADEHISEARKLQDGAFCMAWVVDVRWLDALVAARRCDGASLVQRGRLVARIALDLRALDAWASSCPANFEAHALLARAELLRVTGRGRAAAAAYERAAASARAHGSAKREAVAYELAMRHAKAGGREGDAGRYRILAAAAYRRWGATARAEEIEAGGARVRDSA
jgi:hypothetical protein